MCCPTTKFIICFSLVRAGSDFFYFFIFILPADKLGSVKTSKYTDKSLPLSFQNVKKGKKEIDNKICIVHCSTLGNKRNVCAFLCEDPSRISFGKMSKVCFLHFTSPSVFEKAVFANLMQEYLTV